MENIVKLPNRNYIKNLEIIHNQVNNVFSKYKDLDPNELILKKEFDKIYKNISFDEELLKIYISDTYAFFSNANMFDEDNIDVFPIIIHGLLSKMFKDKYLNNSFNYKQTIIKGLEYSDISFSYYKQAGNTLLDDRIKKLITKLSFMTDDAYRYCETMLTERDYNYKYNINNDCKYLEEVIQDMNNSEGVFTSFEIDDIYNTCNHYINFISDLSVNDNLINIMTLDNLEKIKSINYSSLKDKNTFIEIVKKINTLDISAFDKISKVLDIVDRYITDDNKVIELNFKNKNKKNSK